MASIRFEKPGTLVRPGPIGRIVRLVLGMIFLSLLYDFTSAALRSRAGLFGLAVPKNVPLWVGIALAYWGLPQLVNSGLPSNNQESPVPHQKRCPHCAELLGLGKFHICPVACCYVGLGGESLIVVCPYCGNTFDTAEGHVCLELIKLSQPAQ